MPPANSAFARFIRVNSEALTVYRRDDTTSSSYGNSYSYSELGERDICMAGLEESMQPLGPGERQSQRVVAYTTSGVDLQVNDRIDYGGERYEVLTKEAKPKESDAAIQRYELDNV